LGEELGDLIALHAIDMALHGTEQTMVNLWHIYGLVDHYDQVALCIIAEVPDVSIHNLCLASWL
jgi:hypothetical protein